MELNPKAFFMCFFIYLNRLPFCISQSYTALKQTFEKNQLKQQMNCYSLSFAFCFALSLVLTYVIPCLLIPIFSHFFPSSYCRMLLCHQHQREMAMSACS